ncbi:MAG: polysaccharide biosynthesis/export family protein [Bryobacteraceae bacterium]
MLKLLFSLVALSLVAGDSVAAAERQTEKPSAKAPEQAEPAGPAGRTVVGGAPVDPKTYIIGPEDVLLVRVWREAELSGQFPVRPDGKISLPLVNEVQAAGVTPGDLAQIIAKGLAKYMTKPEVNVAVVQVNSKKYFIIGEVQKPGSYPLTVPTTVLEALVNAGGFRDFANPKKIVLLRKGQRLKFNYKDVIAGKHMEQNVLLESGDQIIVP